MIVPGLAQAKLAYAAGKVWFWLAAILLILALGFYAGKRWEVGNTIEAKAERDKAAQAAKDWKAVSNTYRDATSMWEKRYAIDRQRAIAAAEQAGRLLDELAAQRVKAEKEAKAWQKRYAEALQNPDCAELLKETRCAAFSRY